MISNNLVISFLLNRRSYWAEIASDATNEQSDTIVCKRDREIIQKLEKYF